MPPLEAEAPDYRSWFEKMEAEGKQSPVVGGVTAVMAFVLVAGMLLSRWMMVEAHGEGVVTAGLFVVKATLDDSYLAVSGIRYCESHNYTQVECQAASNCCAWDLLVNKCVSTIGNEICAVEGAVSDADLKGEGIAICSDDSSAVALLGSQFHEDICSNIVTTRWLLAASIGFMVVASIMFCCRVYTKGLAKAIVILGAGLGALAFWIYVDKVYHELVGIVTIRYFSEFEPPRGTYKWQKIYHVVGSALLLVLWGIVFPGVFVMVLEFNYLLFKSRRPRKTLDFDAEITRLQSKKRNRVAPM